MHIILHALVFLVVAQCVTVMNINHQRSKGRRPEQNTAFNAKTELFATVKICGNALKQGSRTYSALRQRSSQLQKYKVAH